jgi:hypothetical protein
MCDARCSRTAHDLSSTKICYRHHPCYGIEVEVIRHLRRIGSVILIVRFPDGQGSTQQRQSISIWLLFVASRMKPPIPVSSAGHIRTAPIPFWVKAAIDEWRHAAGITEGALFRSIYKTGRVWGTGMTPKVLWEIVREAASRASIDKIAPHDLRRSCARLCHLAGGEACKLFSRRRVASWACAVSPTPGIVG